MSVGKKYLKLAIQAYGERKYAEAGALFAHACEQEDLDAEFGNVESVSASSLRSVVTPSRVSAAIAASLEATASEGFDDVDSEDGEFVDDLGDRDIQPDPDFPDEPLIPASFSSYDDGDDVEFVIVANSAIRLR